jgi:hypothetical protein
MSRFASHNSRKSIADLRRSNLSSGRTAGPSYQNLDPSLIEFGEERRFQPGVRKSPISTNQHVGYDYRATFFQKFNTVTIRSASTVFFLGMITSGLRNRTVGKQCTPSA